MAEAARTPCCHGADCRERNIVGAHHENGSCAKVCSGQRVHMGEDLVQGGSKACVEIAFHLPLFRKTSRCEPEIENCLQIN